MSRLQEDFWEQVAKPYGQRAPLRHELRAKGYRSLDAYKVQVGTTRALKSEIETLEGARDKAKHSAVTAKRELDGLERQRVETRAKLGAVTEQVDEKRAQAAEIDRRIAEKWPSLTAWTAKSAKSSSFATRWAMKSSGVRAIESLRRGTRAVARDVEELRPVAAEIGRWEAADALSAAQSSIQSLLDAQERREQLERQLRSLETASGR